MELNNKIEESTDETIGKESPCKSPKSQISKSQVKEEFKMGVSLEFKNGKDNEEYTKTVSNEELNVDSVQTSDKLDANSPQSNGNPRSCLLQKREQIHNCLQNNEMKGNNNLEGKPEVHTSNSICANNSEEYFCKNIQESNDGQSNGKATGHRQICEKSQNQKNNSSMDLSKINELSTDQEVEDSKQDNGSQSLGELSVDVTSYSDPIHWDIKYAVELMNFVAIFYNRKYRINPKWNPCNYDYIPENPNVVFGPDDAEKVESVLLFNREYYEELFYSMFDYTAPIDQSMFDSAVNLLLQEKLYDHYFLSQAFQLATAIAIFAIHSSQCGFSDALYHAVHSIITNVKILRNSYRNQSCNLLMICRRN